MCHRETTPQNYRLDRTGDLLLEFDGWLVATVRTENHTYKAAAWSRLTLYETVGGNWVTYTTMCSADGHADHAASIHPSRDDAVRCMGLGHLALAIRRQLGYPLVESGLNSGDRYGGACARALHYEMDQHGAWTWLVWAFSLKLGVHLAAISSTEARAEKYAADLPHAGEYAGCRFHVERAPVDHTFGASDLRSVAWRAAMKDARRRRGGD